MLSFLIIMCRVQHLGVTGLNVGFVCSGKKQFHKYFVLKTGFRIRIDIYADPDTDPDPAFFLIADPDPEFDDLKLKKFTAGN